MNLDQRRGSGSGTNGSRATVQSSCFNVFDFVVHAAWACDCFLFIHDPTYSKLQAKRLLPTLSREICSTLHVHDCRACRSKRQQFSHSISFGLRSKPRVVVELRETGSGGVNETVRSDM